MPTDPRVPLLRELERRATAWKVAMHDTRCSKCGTRAHRSLEEIALFEAVSALEQYAAEPARFAEEAPTTPKATRRSSNRPPKKAT
jgi:hypothetical protein